MNSFTFCRQPGSYMYNFFLFIIFNFLSWNNSQIIEIHVLSYAWKMTIFFSSIWLEKKSGCSEGYSFTAISVAQRQETQKTNLGDLKKKCLFSNNVRVCKSCENTAEGFHMSLIQFSPMLTSCVIIELENEHWYNSIKDLSWISLVFPLMSFLFSRILFRLSHLI